MAVLAEVDMQQAQVLKIEEYIVELKPRYEPASNQISLFETTYLYFKS